MLDELIKKYGTKKRVPDYKGRRWKQGGLMLVGQDPGITTETEVCTVLMLDNKESSLAKYVLKNILKPLRLKIEEIVAVNLIEMHFGTSVRKIAQEQRIPFAKLVYKLTDWNCFLEKIKKYQPSKIVTLGKPVFDTFTEKLNTGEKWDKSKVGIPEIVEIASQKIMWIPCVHMNTFRRWKKYYKCQPSKLKRI